MSRGYRIRWPQPVSIQRTDTAKASDALRMDVDLLPILDAGEMRALLGEVLELAGWARVDGQLQIEIDGATVRLEADHVAIHLEGSRSVAGTGRSAADAEARLAANRTAAEERLTADLRARMGRIEAALCEQLEPAVQEVYIEALKRKAAKLGEVQSVDERRDGDAVELTIKVKV